MTYTQSDSSIKKGILLGVVCAETMIVVTFYVTCLNCTQNATIQKLIQQVLDNFSLYSGIPPKQDKLLSNKIKASF